MCKILCCCCLWCRDCCCPSEDNEGVVVMTDIKQQHDEGQVNEMMEHPYDQVPESQGEVVMLTTEEGVRGDTRKHEYQNELAGTQQANANGVAQVETPPYLRPSIPSGDQYYAKYDFDVSHEPYIQCNRGERVKILEGGDSWSFVELENKQQGYIPNSYLASIKSLESFEWYFGTLSRQECDRLLKRSPATRGTFMVRDCLSKPDQFSLSVLQDSDTVAHYRIFHCDDGFFLERGLTFSDFPELIGHYQESVSGLLGRLIAPCKQRIAPPMLSLQLNSLRVQRSEVKRLEMLDAGFFGKVYKGRWKNYTIAIKTPKEGVMNKKDFLDEAERMAKLRHKNVVQLCGVVAEEPLYIITEYMVNGSLLDYMREGLEPKDPWALLEQTTVAIQVADGMSYLEEMRFVHRDLRAANVLVGENLVCKVADFGLARFMQGAEYKSKGNTFPVRWTAPEVIAFNSYTHKSDVWSYGVLLYEIATKGAQPYAGEGHNDIMKYVSNGNFLNKPAQCDDVLYSIMTQCWGKTVDDRPGFSDIKNFLCENFGPLAEPSFEND